MDPITGGLIVQVINQILELVFDDEKAFSEMDGYWAIGTAVSVLLNAHDARSEFVKLDKQVKTWAEENRPPSVEERADWKARSFAASERIQAAAEAAAERLSNRNESQSNNSSSGKSSTPALNL